MSLLYLQGQKSKLRVRANWKLALRMEGQCPAYLRRCKFAARCFLVMLTVNKYCRSYGGLRGDMEQKSKEMARLAIEALEDKKAEDIRVIDISEVSVIADYFLIAGGNNRSQIQALCDNVEEKLGKEGLA